MLSILGAGTWVCLFRLAGDTFALVRFSNEFLRADSGGAHVGALTFAPATCLGSAAVAALTILLRH